VVSVRPDRVDHQVRSVSSVDFARYAIDHIGVDELGFGEVMEPVDALRAAVMQHGHRTERAFRREKKSVWRNPMIFADSDDVNSRFRADVNNFLGPTALAVLIMPRLFT
jgi:hypothetical protein